MCHRMSHRHRHGELGVACRCVDRQAPSCRRPDGRGHGGGGRAGCRARLASRVLLGAFAPNGVGFRVWSLVLVLRGAFLRAGWSARPRWRRRATRRSAHRQLRACVHVCVWLDSNVCMVFVHTHAKQTACIDGTRAEQSLWLPLGAGGVHVFGLLGCSLACAPRDVGCFGGGVARWAVRGRGGPGVAARIPRLPCSRRLCR